MNPKGDDAVELTKAISVRPAVKVEESLIPDQVLIRPILAEAHAFPRPYIKPVRKGTSCHQCKNAKSVDKLVYCSKLFEKRTKTDKRCRKKYCETCVQKFYGENFEHVKLKQWICASCRGICSCAACERTKAKKRKFEEGKGDDLIGSVQPSAASTWGYSQYPDLGGSMMHGGLSFTTLAALQSLGINLHNLTPQQYQHIQAYDQQQQQQQQYQQQQRFQQTAAMVMASFQQQQPFFQNSMQALGSLNQSSPFGAMSRSNSNTPAASAINPLSMNPNLLQAISTLLTPGSSSQPQQQSQSQPRAPFSSYSQQSQSRYPQMGTGNTGYAASGDVSTIFNQFASQMSSQPSASASQMNPTEFAALAAQFAMSMAAMATGSASMPSTGNSPPTPSRTFSPRNSISESMLTTPTHSSTVSQSSTPSFMSILSNLVSTGSTPTTSSSSELSSMVALAASQTDSSQSQADEHSQAMQGSPDDVRSATSATGSTDSPGGSQLSQNEEEAAAAISAAVGTSSGSSTPVRPVGSTAKLVSPRGDTVSPSSYSPGLNSVQLTASVASTPPGAEGTGAKTKQQDSAAVSNMQSLFGMNGASGVYGQSALGSTPASNGFAGFGGFGTPNSALNPMAGLANIPGMSGMAAMGGLSGMTGMPGMMSGMSGLAGMMGAGMQNPLTAMSSMPGMGMTGLNPFGTGNFGGAAGMGGFGVSQAAPTPPAPFMNPPMDWGTLINLAANNPSLIQQIASQMSPSQQPAPATTRQAGSSLADLAMAASSVAPPTSSSSASSLSSHSLRRAVSGRGTSTSDGEGEEEGDESSGADETPRR